MSFTLRDIEGALVGRADCDKHSYDEMCKRCHYCGGYNHALLAQSSIRLRFNKLRLAALMEGFVICNVPRVIISTTDALEIADKIISAEKEIIEVDRSNDKPGDLQ